MYEKILIPLDGSELAEQAISYAKGLAKKLNSEVILLNTFASPDRLEDSLKTYMEKKADELRSSGIKASSLHVHGNAATEIINFAEKNNIGLTIMSSHGCTGDRCWALGSIAYKVLQRSYVPTFLTRSLDTAYIDNDLRKILLPLDGSTVAEAIIPYVEGIAKGMDSEVILVRVIEPIRLPFMATYTYHEEYEKSLITKAEKEAESYLSKKISVMQIKGIKATSALLHGKATESIFQYAEDTSASLIALTTHGFSGIAKWAYGSVASHIVEVSPRPILLVRPPLPASDA